MDAIRDATSLQADLGALFAGGDVIQDPYPLYARLREESPVHLFDSGTAIVAPYREAKAVYRDPRRFPNPLERGVRFEDKYSLLAERERAMVAEIIELERSFMSRMNGDKHKRVRGAGQRAFTPKRVAELAASVQRLTDELLTSLAGQETCDLIEFAYRLPLLVVMDLMGAPHEDADMIKEWGDAINRPNAATPVPPEIVREAHAALLDYRSYVEELVARHRESAPTELVGALIDASEGDRLADDELVSFYVLLLFAGHETTTNLIGNGVYAMLRNPDQWALLRSDPTLAAGAVEEALRYDSPVQFFVKQAAADEEVLGVTIPAGTYVMAANAAANRDPEAFPDPDVFDIRRRPNDHLSLGYGVHFCLGAPVARLEGQTAFRTLARRFPDLEPAVDPERMEYGRHITLRGLKELPVRLGRDRGTGAAA